MNVQPSVAEAGFDVRLPPTADPDALRKRIAEDWAPASRNMTFEVNCLLFTLQLLLLKMFGCCLHFSKFSFHNENTFCFFVLSHYFVDMYMYYINHINKLSPLQFLYTWRKEIIYRMRK